MDKEDFKGKNEPNEQPMQNDYFSEGSSESHESLELSALEACFYQDGDAPFYDTVNGLAHYMDEREGTFVDKDFNAAYSELTQQKSVASIKSQVKALLAEIDLGYRSGLGSKQNKSHDDRREK